MAATLRVRLPAVVPDAIRELVESGQIRLNETVASFIPEFGKYGKERVTVRELFAVLQLD